LMSEENVLQPELGGMQVPWPKVSITSENAQLVTELTHWGRGMILRVYWSPDERTFVVQSETGVYLYDAETYAEVGTITIDSDIHYVIFSPDGKIFAVSSSTGVYLYDSETYAEVHTIAQEADINNVIFSPDGSMLIGTDGSLIKVWDVTSGDVLNTFPWQAYWFSNIALSPDGRLLAFGAEDMIKIWDIATGRQVQSIPIGDGSTPVTYLVFSNDGEILISLITHAEDLANGEVTYTNGPYTLKLWDVNKGTELPCLADCAGYSITLSPDNATMAISQDSGMVFLDLESGEKINQLEEYVGYPEVYSPDGAILAGTVKGESSGWNEIKLWDSSTLEETSTLTGHDEMVNSIVFSPDGKRLASASGSLVTIWDSTSGQELHRISGSSMGSNGMDRFGGYGGNVHDLAFSPTADILAIASGINPLKLLDARTGELIAELETKGDYIHCIAFSPDGKLIAAGSAWYDDQDSSKHIRVVQIWDVATQEQRIVLEGFTFTVGSIAFSPDGKTLATQEGIGWEPRGSAKIWDLATGELLHEFGIETEIGEDELNLGIFDVAYSPDGSLLAAVTSDGGVLIWDMAEQKQSTIVAGSDSFVMSAAFSPDGGLLAFSEQAINGGKTDSLRLIDLASSETLFTIEGRVADDIVFSPDGRVFAAASSWVHRNVWLVDVKTGRILATLSSASSVSFSADGRILATGGDVLQLWGIAP
jgi:WD40 repeat protein